MMSFPIALHRRTTLALLVLAIASWFGSSSSSETTTTTSSSTATECLAVPSVQLQNGVDMPLLILGTAQLIHKPGIKPDVHDSFVGMLPERGYRQIELALQNGVRAFDSALIYRSQRAIGYVLAEWFRTGRLVRDDVFITSKIFHPSATEACHDISHMPQLNHMTPQQVSNETRRHFELALSELGMGYVDLMLLHWPSDPSMTDEALNRQRRLEAWKVLETMYRRGWAKAIGVSNFSPRHLEQLKQDGATIVPMVNQFEASVTLQYPEILQYCLDHDIVPQAWSPMGRGFANIPDLVHTIAAKYNKDVGQVSFRYLLQLGYAVCYLTNSPERMVSNTQVFDFVLDDEEMAQLKALHRPDGGWGLPSPLELK